MDEVKHRWDAPTCATCKWYGTDTQDGMVFEELEAPMFGVCRKRAPCVYVRPGWESSLFTYPPTTEHGWCGDHEQYQKEVNETNQK